MTCYPPGVAQQTVETAGFSRPNFARCGLADE
jgi:hypothetical protein